MATGRFMYSSHAMEEMAVDDLTTVDCQNTLRSGVVRAPDLEKGSWRYRVETSQVAVVIAFRSEEHREMKCIECGAAMSTRLENYKYEACGLRYVTLKGIEVSRCPACGNQEVAIPRIDELHRLIAKCLVEKVTRFTGMEIRFLRKCLDLSGAKFARRMGVTLETVSRWENDAVPIGTQADRLLRLLVAQGRLAASYPAEKLDLIDARNANETRLGVKMGSRAWAVESSAR